MRALSSHQISRSQKHYSYTPSPWCTQFSCRCINGNTFNVALEQSGDNCHVAESGKLYKSVLFPLQRLENSGL